MLTSNDRPLLRSSARVRLSSHGHSTEAAYRSHVSGANGPNRRKAFEYARAEWAQCNGLEPDDGAYLGELRIATLTIKELGEALAICGQTREMVSDTVKRLLSRGFLEKIVAGEPRSAGRSFHRARQELSTVEYELTSISRELETDHIVDRRMIGDRLRQATSRVVDARRFLESLSETV
jgi:plasmid stability protein